MSQGTFSLQKMFAGAEKLWLAAHIAFLHGVDWETVGYGDKFDILVPRLEAIRVARQVYQVMVDHDIAIAKIIRAAADLDFGDAPGPHNLGDWVGHNTLAWRVVFSYSDIDTERRAPWFLELGEEAQRVCLLLVASDLEG